MLARRVDDCGCASLDLPGGALPPPGQQPGRPARDVLPGRRSLGPDHLGAVRPGRSPDHRLPRRRGRGGARPRRRLVGKPPRMAHRRRCHPRGADATGAAVPHRQRRTGGIHPRPLRGTGCRGRGMRAARPPPAGARPSTVAATRGRHRGAGRLLGRRLRHSLGAGDAAR